MFSPVNEEDLSFSNTLIGHYTVHCASQGERPILYLVDIEAIKSPTVGIPNVGWTRPNGHPKMQSEQHHLFLVRRKADWPLAWDSMIDDLADDADDQSVENEYKKVVTLANGAKIVSVKTDEEMAADETATNATAGQTTSQSKPAARSKRPPRKTAPLGRQPPPRKRRKK